MGRGSEWFALQIKGKELERMPQRNGYQMALALAVCEAGPDHTRWYPPYPPNPRSIPAGMGIAFRPVRGLPDTPYKKFIYVKYVGRIAVMTGRVREALDVGGAGDVAGVLERLEAAYPGFC